MADLLPLIALFGPFAVAAFVLAGARIIPTDGWMAGNQQKRRRHAPRKAQARRAPELEDDSWVELLDDAQESLRSRFPYFTYS